MRVARSLLKLPAALGLIVALGFGFFDGADQVWLLMLAVSGVLLALLLWPRRAPGQPVFSRTVQRLATLLLIGFILTSAQLVRQQVVLAPALAARSELVDGAQLVADPRRRNELLQTRRGAIYDNTGQMLAGSEAAGDGYARRTYLSVEAAPLIGYYSPLVYGSNGLEDRYDDILSGRAGGGGWATVQRQVLHRPPEGYDLHLTINQGLQRVAAEALGDRSGAIVALNPKTGAVLAMVSNPHVDPRPLVFDPAAANWDTESNRIVRAWQNIAVDAGNPLLPRATQGLYAPGSIFKTITAAAILDAGLATPESRFEDRGELRVDSHVIRELNRPNPPKNEYTLAEAFRFSLNVVFAQLALKLGPERLADYSQRFGFDTEIPFDLRVARSQVANSPEFLERKTGLADTGYGQGELLVSPLHMALVAATIANDGRMMQPHLVSSITTRDGRVLQRWRPAVWRTPINEATARTMRTLMVQTVEQGQGSPARIPGVQIGGKTGTAEIGVGTLTHAWFIAFGPEPDPQIALAVVVEEGGGGGRVAAPIAKRVLEYALQRR
ncbi:MAG: penicillin-binding protein 2 [Chloroflexi bacterium]|nr:penicillin-binding protein 2 [Chloroflexota bacterium]